MGVEITGPALGRLTSGEGQEGPLQPETQGRVLARVVAPGVVLDQLKGDHRALIPRWDIAQDGNLSFSE
jgi:hypothetical protein